MERLDPAQEQEGGVVQRVGAAVRRIGVTALGGVVTVIALVLLVTPGPGLLVLAAGLAILATEYAWARHVLHRLRARSREAYQRARAHRQARGEAPDADPS